LTKHTINIIIDAIMVTHPVVQCIRQRDRALALGVGFFLFAVYLFSYRGGFHSVDEVSMFAVAESLVKFGEFNTDQIAWTQWTTSQREAQGFFGIDGHVYSKKGLAISLAMAPLYWLGLVIPGLGMLQTASLLNAVVTALTGGLLFLLVRRLGYDQRITMGVTLLYGLTTIAWVYSKYLFSEPLAGLLLVSTAYLLVVHRQEGKNWYVALAGLLAGLAVVTRANNLFLVPIFGLYLVAASQVAASQVAASRVAGSRVTTEAKPSQQTPNSPDTGPFSLLPTPYSLLPTPYSLLPTVYFLLGLIPPALMLMGYNWARTGNPLQTGYDLTIFSPHVLLGLYKLLFSPLRGLFIYSPILLLSIPGLTWLWQRHRAETALILGVTGVTIGLFSVWSSGEGLSWGSRFLVPVIPLLCLALAPVLARGLAGSKALIGLILVLGGLSLIIQLLGVAINPWVYLAKLQTDFGGEFFLENTPALTDFRYTQINGQLRSWSPTNSDLVWWQPGDFDAIAFGLSLILVAITATNLGTHISSSKPRILNSFGTFTIILLATYFLLTRYFITDQRQFGPPDDAYTRALNAATERASPNDWLVTVAQNHYHVPMNRFKARIPIIGFAQQQPPIPETALPLLKDSLTGQHTWLTTIGFLPAAPNNATEQWLTFNAFKASDKWFDDVRLVWYGAQEPTVTRSIDAILGEELHVVSVNVAETSQPGQVLPVEFVWVPLQRPSADYNVFLQLFTADGTLVAQHDGPPNGGYTPTSAWLPGKKISDRHGMALPAELPAANYQLIAGMYDPNTGERLPVDQGRDFVELGSVAVETPSQ
jgi:hypothetical protein